MPAVFGRGVDIHSWIMKESEKLGEEVGVAPIDWAFQAWCLGFAHESPSDDAANQCAKWARAEAPM
jgi:hypothetical protein